MFTYYSIYSLGGCWGKTTFDWVETGYWIWDDGFCDTVNGFVEFVGVPPDFDIGPELFDIVSPCGTR